MRAPLLILVLLMACAAVTRGARLPYYDAVVVEGRDDSEGGAHENETFESEDCLLPPMAGPCRAGIPMFYYVASTGKCAKFRWGGCGGNKNRFQSRSQCERRCSALGQQQNSNNNNNNERPAAAVEAACTRSPHLVRCGQGCFISRDQEGCYECKCGAATIPTSAPLLAESNEAGAESRDICELPPVRGHCRALLARWTYNAATGRCQEFRFGGCDGNGNNFLSASECQEACEGRRRGSRQPAAQPQLQDRYDLEQPSSSYSGTTDYTSAAAKILRFVFQRFWQQQ